MLGVGVKVTTAYLVLLVRFVEFPLTVESRRVNSCGLGPKVKYPVKIDAKHNAA